MSRRFALLALFCLTGPALAQTAPPPEAAAPPPIVAAPPPAPAVKPATVRVSLQTAEGNIVLELEKELAPITTANFLRYIAQKRFDGTTFYRATKVGDGYGLIQGGVRNNPKLTLPPVAHEPTSRTGLSHVDGTISMARTTPGSASGDFFITVGALTSLDADPAKSGDNLGFAAFGHVVEGMDVVKRILAAPIDPAKGDGAMKGQLLAAPVRIVTARRVASVVPAPAAGEAAR